MQTFRKRRAGLSTTAGLSCYNCVIMLRHLLTICKTANSSFLSTEVPQLKFTRSSANAATLCIIVCKRSLKLTDADANWNYTHDFPQVITKESFSRRHGIEKTENCPTLFTFTISHPFHKFPVSDHLKLHLLVGMAGWGIVKWLINSIRNARLLKRPNLNRMIHATWHYVWSCDVNVLTINQSQNRHNLNITTHWRNHYTWFSHVFFYFIITNR